jgi:hypothetical protein
MIKFKKNIVFYLSFKIKDIYTIKEIKILLIKIK